MALDGTIKPIDKASIHRICSGQVVLDLSAAVKELVENSLDAGATRIEVRLKDYGAELIEVADNGTGVSPENYQSLTLKYHTSKISEFADLQSLTTFGFRGEALSSLCALGRVRIVTRTEKEEIAVRLEYDHSGLIISQQNVARAVGTTVSVAKLFSSLPVRFKEFSRNIRREYSRLLCVLQGYALISNGVRFICSNENGRAGRITVVHTQGECSLRDNIVTLFGTKTAACMERLELTVSDSCRIEGFISRRGPGCGRSSGDRQFLYVNGRPVDMPKIVKVLNELYRLSNSRQYPMFVLNIVLPTMAYDVNVTPDKRKLFLHSEASLLEALRESLDKVYTANTQIYTINSVESVPLSQDVESSGRKSGRLEKLIDNPLIDDGDDEDRCYQQEDLPRMSKDTGTTEPSPSGQFFLDAFSFQPKLTKCLNGQRHNAASSTQHQEPLPNSQFNGKIQAKLTSFVSRDKMDGKTSLAVSGMDMNDQDTTLPKERSAKSVDGIVSCSVQFQSKTTESEEINANLPSAALQTCGNNFKEGGSSFTPSVSEVEETINLPGQVAKTCESALTSQLGKRKLLQGKPDERQLPLVSQMLGPCSTTGYQKRAAPFVGELGERAWRLQGEMSDVKQRLAEPELQNNEDDFVAGCVHQTKTSANQVEAKQRRSVIEFDLEKFQRKLDMGLLSMQTREHVSQQQRQQIQKNRFAAATLNGVGKEGIEKETILKAASKELERSFNKADFKRMKVLGQFNLGFILAKIDEDIFIIDQHASDEKYNFERLLKTTELNRQPLLKPLPLELSAVEEITVLSHLKTFRENGFDFVVNDDAQAGKRLQLSAVPFSQNTTFGVGDVQELIALLSDEPVRSIECGTAHADSTSGNGLSEKTPQKLSSFLPRPSRVKMMLASRACRSSVMIGDPLSKREMEQIIAHLSELDSPWNCPHGRPTMRHLIDLSSL